jgi:NCS1 family nucleobase:cation symporter-1
MPVVFFVPVHKLRKFLYPSIVITTITLFGILGWAIHENHGTGPLISSSIKLTSSQKAFTFLQCVSSTAAVWSGSGDRLADWTRFGKSRHSATPALITGLPIMLTISSIIGALTTSAFYSKYGSAI